MPYSVYPVSNTERMKFAAQFDHLDQPASFPEQKKWSLDYPVEHARRVDRIVNALFANPAIANLHEYKFKRCRNVEHGCPLKDSCRYVHTQAYKDAIEIYKWKKKERLSKPPVSKPVSATAPSPSSSDSVSIVSSAFSPPASSPIERARTVPIPAVSAPPRLMVSPVSLPVFRSESPNRFGPYFGMPPLIIIDDIAKPGVIGPPSAQLIKQPRNILFGFNWY